MYAGPGIKASQSRGCTHVLRGSSAGLGSCLLIIMCNHMAPCNAYLGPGPTSPVCCEGELLKTVRWRSAPATAAL